MFFPEADLPNSFEISTVIVNILPFNFISQFFMEESLLIGSIKASNRITLYILGA